MKNLIILFSILGMLWAVVPEAQADHYRHYRRVVYVNRYGPGYYHRSYNPYYYGYRPVRYYRHSDCDYPRYYSTRYYSSPRFAFSIGF